jgi:hypothetical protein
MKYQYNLSGIILSTDIYIEELIQTNGEQVADVFVSYGNVPDNLDESNVDFPFIQANERQYLLILENFGKYLVEDGNKITIESFGKASPKEVEMYLLTNLLGALSYQNNLLPMHGGVVDFNGEGILITGTSGSGKSTMLAGLMKAGYRVVTDDISIVRNEKNKFVVFPSFPYMFLWGSTLKKLNLDHSNLSKLRNDMEKYILPNDFGGVTTPIEIKKTIILVNKEIKESEYTLKGIGKIESLRRNCFKPWMINSFNKQKGIFHQLSSFSNNTRLEVFRNDQKAGINKSLELFINTLKDGSQ